MNHAEGICVKNLPVVWALHSSTHYVTCRLVRYFIRSRVLREELSPKPPEFEDQPLSWPKDQAW